MQRPALVRLSAQAGFVLAFALPAAQADTLISSAASQSLTTSSGSLSRSLENSSESSSGGKTAAGPYRVTEVAEAADRPGMTRLTLLPLEAAAPAGTQLRLYVPHETVAAAGIVPNGTVHVRERAYGLEFAHGEPQRAFFLALADDWLHDLKTRRVAL